MATNTKPLKDALRKALEFKDKELIHRQEWGEINFEEARFDVEGIISIVMTLENLPVEYLTDTVIERISNSINNAVAPLADLSNFSLKSSGDINSRKSQIVSNIHGAAEILTSTAASWIPYLAYQKGDVARNIEKLAKTIGDAEERMSEGVNAIAEKQAEADAVLVKAREAAAGAGAAVFTSAFEQESDKNLKNSWWWLGATVLFLLLAGGISVWTYCEDYTQYNTALQLWPKLACRMIMLSLCVTAALWCGKVYKAMRHVSLLNRHRALGLKTFQAFSAAASDSRTKDAVLMETTHSIFATGSTGLISEGGSSEPDSNIIQIAGRMMDQANN